MTAQAPSCERCNDAKQVRLVGDWGPLGVSERIIDCPDCQPKPSEGTDDKQLAAIRASCETPARAGTQYQADVRFLFATIERQAGEIETLHARNQSRELRIAELEADLAAARLNERRYLWLLKHLRFANYMGRQELALPLDRSLLPAATDEHATNVQSAIDAAIAAGDGK